MIVKSGFDYRSGLRGGEGGRRTERHVEQAASEGLVTAGQKSETSLYNLVKLSMLALVFNDALLNGSMKRYWNPVAGFPTLRLSVPLSVQLIIKPNLPGLG